MIIAQFHIGKKIQGSGEAFQASDSESPEQEASFPTPGATAEVLARMEPEPIWQ